MKFLVLWLGSIIASVGMDFANGLRMYKDAADNGYKINSKKKTENTEKLAPGVQKNMLYSFLIPIVNMLLVIERTMQYNNQRFAIIDQLKVMDCLDEMSDYEKREYAKNPTAFNAWWVPFKYEIKLAKATKISFEGKGTVYIEDENNGGVIILKSTGDFRQFDDRYNDYESFVTDLRSIIRDSKDGNVTEKVNENNQKLAHQPLNNTESLEKLSNLKQQLIEEKESLQHQSQDTDDVSYVKKR